MPIDQQLLLQKADRGRFFTETEVRERGRKMYEQYSQLITLYLEINPTPSDAQFHALAEACGVDKETLEACAYQMLAEHEGADVPVDAELTDNERFSGEKLGADIVDLIPDAPDQEEDGDAPVLAEPPEEQELVEDENSETFHEQAEGDDEEGDDVEDDVDASVGLLAALTPGVDDNDMSIEERTLADDVQQEYLSYKDAALTDGSKDPKDSTEVQDDTWNDGAHSVFDKGQTNSDGPVVPSITKKTPEDAIAARVLYRLAAHRTIAK